MTARTDAEKQLLENFRKLDEDGQDRVGRYVESAAYIQPFRTYLRAKGLSTLTMSLEELEAEQVQFRACQA